MFNLSPILAVTVFCFFGSVTLAKPSLVIVTVTREYQGTRVTCGGLQVSDILINKHLIFDVRTYL